MRLPTARRAAPAVLCLLAAALGIAPASLASGGLSVSPGILEGTARPGNVGALSISNTTGRPMKVSFVLRPWLQSRSGTVSPDRRRTLGALSPSRSSFGLAGGATRTLQLRLARLPARRSLYGAIEVTGTPRRRHTKKKNIQVAYRLISSLRLNPPKRARRYRARPRRLFEQGRVRRGALFLAVKNAGNTIVPTGGIVRISGHRHTLSGIVEPKAILPGATVNLRLARLRGSLPRGRYSVSVRLTQGHHRAGALHRRRFRLR